MPRGRLSRTGDAGREPFSRVVVITLVWLLPVDKSDCEAVLARFTEAGVKLETVAAQLQAEGAKAFVKSWEELLAVIASKSHALKQVP